MLANAVLGVMILAAALLAALAFADVRDHRRPDPPIRRRELDHYDADGRDDRSAS